MYKSNYDQLPDNLPKPVDDGAAMHLPGQLMPELDLTSTRGGKVNLKEWTGTVVMYCYPMTGVPGIPLPDGWDQIPGARGCTPQSCSYRDHYQELLSFGARVVGLSSQSTEYQLEMATRLHLPFEVLSDSDLQCHHLMKLPVFQTAGMTLYKRLTLIIQDGVIEAVHYPIFPSDSDVLWVLDYLKRKALITD